MNYKSLLLGLTTACLLSTAIPVLADDNTSTTATDGSAANATVENEFTLALVSGPQGSEVTIDDNVVKFATAGDYLFQVISEEPDLVPLTDETVGLTVQLAAPDKPIKVKFGFEFAGGPPGGEITTNNQTVSFNLPGHYALRVTPNNTTQVVMTDANIETEVQSLQQVEAEWEAMAASLPDSPVQIEKVQLNSAFLPVVSNGQHAQHDHGSDEASAAALAAVDELFADEFGAFDKNRIPVELQAWWTPAFGHIHVAVLVPLGQPVSGVLNVPVRIVMHENPSVLTQLRIDSDEGVEMKVPLGKIRCLEVICAWSLNVPLDTKTMSSGWRELRFRGETIAPDGRKYLNSSGIPVLVQNGGSAKNYNRFCNNTSLIGRGWYDGFGYTNAVVECVPTAPVSGVWNVRVKAQQSSASLIVDMDRAHVIPAVSGWPYQPALAGSHLLEVKGNQSSWVTVSIDTRKLSNGWHNLFVRSDGPKGMVSQCSGCPNVVSHPAGIAKFWFYVKN